jgi:hypothetical protein
MVGLVTGIGLTAGLTAVAAAGSLAIGGYEASQSGSEASSALSLAQNTAGEQGYYNNLLKTLIANPSSVGQLPGFQFQEQTGAAAVADQMAAGGFAGSGNEGAALTSFGQGLASSFYGQQTQLLSALSGVTAPSSPASSINAATGATGQATSTISSLLNSLGFYGMLGYQKGQTGAPASTPAGSINVTGAPANQPIDQNQFVFN